MTIKGYPDQQKSSGGEANYATVSPAREQQHALDVISHHYVQKFGSDAAETGSTASKIKATGHAVLVGDVISFTSGNLNTKEYRVRKVETDYIYPAETMSEAPANTDAFDILRPKYPVVGSDGKPQIGVTLANDTGYGVVGANTLRTAAEIGNASGAADFGAGNASAQTLRTVIATDQAAVPVSATALPLPTGAATEAKQDTGNTSLASIDAALAGTLLVSGNVDVLSSALPTGAATEAKQDTGNTSLAAIDTKLGATLSVDGSGVTQPISAAALPLPTGAATSAKQDTGNTSLASIDGKLGSLGQKAMAASAPVVIASDQSAVPVSLATVNPANGRSNALLYRNDYSSSNVTTGAYVEVSAATAADINRLHVFDSSGSAMIIATGAAASEVDQLYVPPGGSDGPFEINIPSGTRIAIKALDADATSGQIIITGLT